MDLHKIETYLSEKEFSHDGIDSMAVGSLELVTVSIEWGDWRHDHIRLQHLMKAIGWNLLTIEVTEEDGSDCYSAIHVYHKAEDTETVELYRELFATAEEE